MTKDPIILTLYVENEDGSTYTVEATPKEAGAVVAVEAAKPETKWITIRKARM
jgi:hypothetical protein